MTSKYRRITSGKSQYAQQVAVIQTKKLILAKLLIVVYPKSALDFSAKPTAISTTPFWREMIGIAELRGWGRL